MHEIAAKAGLNERYVREWLGAMVTSGVVAVDAEDPNRFGLPPEHAVSLTRAAAADNIAAFTQYISLLGGVEDDIDESTDWPLSSAITSWNRGNRE